MAFKIVNNKWLSLPEVVVSGVVVVSVGVVTDVVDSVVTAHSRKKHTLVESSICIVSVNKAS